ncbi:MAG: hypothetical protein R2852_09985 [Bacteroidia bacterium]
MDSSLYPFSFGVLRFKIQDKTNPKNASFAILDRKNTSSIVKVKTNEIPANVGLNLYDSGKVLLQRVWSRYV